MGRKKRLFGELDGKLLEAYDQVSLHEFRKDIHETKAAVNAKGEPVLVTVYGKPEFAVVSLEDAALLLSVKKQGLENKR